MGLDIWPYEGVFQGRLGPVFVHCDAVQWDGTYEMYVAIGEWIESVRPNQGVGFYEGGDDYLGTTDDCMTIGVGNDFGDFHVATAGDYVYLTDGRFLVSDEQRFLDRYWLVLKEKYEVKSKAQKPMLARATIEDGSEIEFVVPSELQRQIRDGLIESYSVEEK